MGRIDEALRRASNEDRAGAPLPQPASGANDAFTELIEAKDQRKILVLP